VTDDAKARAWGLLLIGLTVTAVPVAAAITIARDLVRKLIRYDQLGEW
jgi:hypothetical protein